MADAEILSQPKQSTPPTDMDKFLDAVDVASLDQATAKSREASASESGPETSALDLTQLDTGIASAELASATPKIVANPPENEYDMGNNMEEEDESEAPQVLAAESIYDLGTADTVLSVQDEASPAVVATPVPLAPPASPTPAALEAPAADLQGASTVTGPSSDAPVGALPSLAPQPIPLGSFEELTEKITKKVFKSEPHRARQCSPLLDLIAKLPDGADPALELTRDRLSELEELSKTDTSVRTFYNLILKILKNENVAEKITDLKLLGEKFDEILNETNANPLEDAKEITEILHSISQDKKASASLQQSASNEIDSLTIETAQAAFELAQQNAELVQAQDDTVDAPSAPANLQASPAKPKAKKDPNPNAKEQASMVKSAATVVVGIGAVGATAATMGPFAGVILVAVLVYFAYKKSQKKEGEELTEEEKMAEKMLAELDPAHRNLANQMAQQMGFELPQAEIEDEQEMEGDENEVDPTLEDAGARIPKTARQAPATKDAKPDSAGQDSDGDSLGEEDDFEPEMEEGADSGYLDVNEDEDMEANPAAGYLHVGSSSDVVNPLALESASLAAAPMADHPILDQDGASLAASGDDDASHQVQVIQATHAQLQATLDQAEAHAAVASASIEAADQVAAHSAVQSIATALASHSLTAAPPEEVPLSMPVIAETAAAASQPEAQAAEAKTPAPPASTLMVDRTKAALLQEDSRTYSGPARKDVAAMQLTPDFNARLSAFEQQPASADVASLSSGAQLEAGPSSTTWRTRVQKRAVAAKAATDGAEQESNGISAG